MVGDGVAEPGMTVDVGSAELWPGSHVTKG